MRIQFIKISLVIVSMTSERIPVLELPILREGIFISRPNRFVSEIEYNNEISLAHIHDPGRLEELLVPGSKILFTDSKGKLDFYIKAVKADEEWVLIDTSLHSKIASRIFSILPEFSDLKELKSEVPIGSSRIDFLIDGIPLEVKGVTLVKDGIALFPDAPTERGTRHVQEIMDHNGIIMFLVFRKATSFLPNFETDPKFSKKLSEARRKNIKIIVLQLSFDGKKIYFQGKIPLSQF